MEKKMDSQTIFQGKIITVYKDKVKCPNEKIATREIVRHHGGVGILATVDDKIILVKQFRYAYNQDTIENYHDIIVLYFLIYKHHYLIYTVLM